MKLSDRIDNNIRGKLRNLSSKSRPDDKKQTTNSRCKEKLSPNDLKDLMGENRQTYKRGKGGAVRRK